MRVLFSPYEICYESLILICNIKIKLILRKQQIRLLIIIIVSFKTFPPNPVFVRNSHSLSTVAFQCFRLAIYCRIGFKSRTVQYTRLLLIVVSAVARLTFSVMKELVAIL